MIDAIWLVFMYYFYQIKSKKAPLFIIKIIIIATHLATLALAIRDAPREIKKTML